MHSKRIPKFSKTFTGIFTVPFSFGPEISEILVEWKAPTVSYILGLVAMLFTRSSMDALRDDSGYKKWRFQAESEPSRSTLWRRRKLKRKILSNPEEELHQQDFQDEDTCKHVRGATSKLQSGTELTEVGETMQSDSTLPSFSDHFCLGKCRF